jgi:hypothetical protein
MPVDFVEDKPKIDFIPEEEYKSKIDFVEDIRVDMPGPSAQIAGGVEKNYTQNWDNKGRVYYTDEDGNIVDNGLNVFQKAGRKTKAALSNIGDWINEPNPESKAYKQKANTTLALATLPIGVSAKFAQPAVNALKPFVGRKIAQMSVQGAGAGLVSGGVEGVGRGFIEGENPLVTGLQGAGLGLGFGGLGGAALGYGGRYFAGRRLSNIGNTESLTKPELQQFRKNAKKYYQDYIQGTNTKHNDLGNISFTGVGVGETLHRNPQGATTFNRLKKNIQNAENKGLEAPNHQRTDDIAGFNRLANENEQYLIAQTDNGNKYYMTEQNPNSGTLRNSKAENRISDTIIPDNAQNVNPAFKERGGIQSVEKTFGKEIADAVENKTYQVHGNDYNQRILAQMTPDQRAVMINNPDDVSDLATAARQNSIREQIQQGIIPTQELNRYVDDGTRVGQAMAQRLAANLGTPEGVVIATQAAINKTVPKKAKQVLKKVPDIIKKTKEITDDTRRAVIKKGSIEKELNKLLADTVKRDRRDIIDRVLDMQNRQVLNEETLTALINQKYKIPQITPDDLTQITELADNIRNAASPRQEAVAKGILQKFIGNKLPKNKTDAYRYANMLGSPRSRFGDFISTSIFNGVVNPIDELFAKGVSKTITKPRKGVNTRTGEMYAKDWRKGFGQGLKEGAHDVKLGIRTGRAGEGSNYDLITGEQFNYKPMKEWEGMPVYKKGLQAIENLLHVGEKAVNYSTRVPDRAFYQARYNTSILDQMKAAGLNEPTPEIIEQAVKEAKDTIFQGDNAYTKGSELVRSAFDQVTGPLRLGGKTMPFIKAVANLSKEGVEHSPLGFLQGAFKMKNAATPQELRDAEMLLGKSLAGLTFTAPTGAGIASGALKSNIGQTNSYDSDNITGMRPQSIAIGDKSFSLQNMPYAGIPIAAYAGLFSAGTPGEKLSKSIKNTSNLLADLPALKGIGDLYKTFNSGYGQEKAIPEIADDLTKTYLSNIATQYLPASGLLGNIRSSVDPYARELSANNALSYVANRIMNRLPGISDNLPIKYNLLGEPVNTNNIKNPTLRALGDTILPMGIRNYNENSVLNQLNDDNLKLKRAPKTVTLDDGRKIKVTGKQYSKYQQIVGEQTDRWLDDLMTNPLYLDADPEGRKKIVNTVQNYAKSYAETEIFGKIGTHNKARRSFNRELKKALKNQNEDSEFRNKVIQGILDYYYSTN